MTSEEILGSVMCMLAADGTINAPEKQFLQRVCQRLHISNNVVKTAFERVKQGKGRIAIPEDAKEKQHLLGILVQAALADGAIQQQERTMLNAVAAKIGVPATVLEQYIAKQTTSFSPQHQATSSQGQTAPVLDPAQRTVRKPPETQPTNMMTCPKCGAEQPEALRCEHCGIFIKNYAKQPRTVREQSSESSEDWVPISFYVPSGTLTIAAIPLGALVGLVAAAGVGWVYQLLITWNPLIYLNVIATLLYGVVIGLAVGLGLQLGKCRNMWAGVVLAFILAVIGDLLTFRYAYSSLTDVLAQVENGWTISRFGLPFGIPLRGPVVYLIWGVEFILMCGAAMLASVIGPSEPFCEKCGQWTKKRHLGKIAGINEAYLLQARHEGNLKPFLQAPPQASWKTVSYDMYSCPRCRKSRYIRAIVEWEEEGQKEEEVVLDYALVTHEQIAELRDTLKQCRDRGV